MLKSVPNIFQIAQKNLLSGIKYKSKIRNFKKLQLIDIEPVRGCNLRCRMCHVSFMKEKVQFLDIDSIDFSFCAGKTVTIGAVFEPFIHPEINSLIDALNKVGAKLVIITNGHNLNRKEIPALFESNLELVTFSFDGITQQSYEEIRRGGNFSRTVQNIEKFIKHHKPRGTKFAVNFTVLKRNLNEVEMAPKFWGDRGVDLVRFIGMVVRENDTYLINNNLLNIQEEYSDSLRNAIKVVNDYQLDILISNPRFREWFPIDCPEAIYSRNKNNDTNKFISVHHKYEFNQKSPLGNSCSSPFTTARIDYDGNVYLCHNQIIGNLKTDSFQKIWSSRKAESLRKKLLDTMYLCDSCDYFKLCINSHYLDTRSSENYFSNDFKEKYPAKYSEIVKSLI